jgi:hypothetical protein
MEDNAPLKLHIKVALSDGAPGCLTNRSKGFRQQRIKRTTVLKAGLKLVGLTAQLGITELLKIRLQLVYLINLRLQAADLFFIRISKFTKEFKHLPFP